MSLPNVPHRIGRVNSGDVSIFYRAFGTRGATHHHHARGQLFRFLRLDRGRGRACQRSIDRRDWGESSWSPSKDYSLDAHVADAIAVVSHMGWDNVIFMGHSASGRVVFPAAANFPDRARGLIGGQFGREVDGGPRATLGNPPTMYPSIEVMMSGFARLDSPPRVGLDRERAVNALIRRDGLHAQARSG